MTTNDHNLFRYNMDMMINVSHVKIHVTTNFRAILYIPLQKEEEMLSNLSCIETFFYKVSENDQFNKYVCYFRTLYDMQNFSAFYCDIIHEYLIILEYKNIYNEIISDFNEVFTNVNSFIDKYMGKNKNSLVIHKKIIQHNHNNLLTKKIYVYIKVSPNNDLLGVSTIRYKIYDDFISKLNNIFIGFEDISITPDIPSDKYGDLLKSQLMYGYMIEPYKLVPMTDLNDNVICAAANNSIINVNTIEFKKRISNNKYIKKSFAHEMVEYGKAVIKFYEFIVFINNSISDKKIINTILENIKFLTEKYNI